MGKHDIRGCITGEVLNVTRTVPKWYRPRHAKLGQAHISVVVDYQPARVALPDNVIDMRIKKPS